MFVACGIWCLADVSSISPSSEQTDNFFCFAWPKSNAFFCFLQDNGTFNDAANLYNTSISYEYGGVCPPGYFCPKKSFDPYANPCPNGTYSNQRGLASASECIDCPPGEVCNGVALTSPNGKCRAGWYCSKRASSSMPLDGVTGNICPVGFFCPNGTDTPKECVAGTYRYTKYLSL